MVDKFNSSESVIHFSDKEGGLIKGKYLMQGKIISQYGILHEEVMATITIKVKQNICRIEIKPSSSWSYSSAYTQQQAFTKEDFIAESNLLIDDFKMSMFNNKDIW